VTRRQLVLIGTGLSCLLALTSCATFDKPAATINGTQISMDDFEEDVTSIAQSSVAESLNLLSGDDNTVPAAGSRTWLGARITWLSTEQIMADAGVPLTDAEVSAAEESLGGQISDWNDLPERVRTTISRGVASNTKLNTLDPPPADELAAMYGDLPASTGAVCLRHILVETEAEAEAIAAQLAEGADFATLAATSSIEPAAPETGGALANGDNDCIVLSSFATGFDPGFVNGALRAEAGVPTGPVQSAFGWHVILARPYEEIADDLLGTIVASPGEARLAAKLVLDSDITVASSIGQWDPLGLAVVATTPASGQ
jgi:PPIC-type PPIASE domain